MSRPDEHGHGICSRRRLSWQVVRAIVTVSGRPAARRLLNSVGGIAISLQLRVCARMLIQQLRSSADGRRPLQAMAVAICTVALAACNASKNAYVPPPPPKVVVAQPIQQPVTLYFELTGNTAPINSVDLVARVQGFIESINYQDGAAVTKGTQLFGIERDIYQQQLDQAKATLASNEAGEDYNRSEYQRQAALGKNDFASQATVQEWKSKLDQSSASVLNAKAAIELANINLGYTSVLAPFDGVVTNHLVDLGALVGFSGPTKLASIIQVDPLYVYFTLSEPQILAIQRSLAKHGANLRTSGLSDVPVEIGLQGEDGYPHKGHLDYASPEVDTATGTLTARALFDNKDRALLPGLFVRVRTPIAQQDKALLTRNDAIGTSQEGSYVLVVNAQNVVERRIVKTGEQQGQLRIIESGLDPGDWVVTEGIQRAFPGAKVDPQRVELTAAAADSSGGVKPSADPTPK
jgi:membrane fusion protein, multidrug efflux system